MKNKSIILLLVFLFTFSSFNIQTTEAQKNISNLKTVQELSLLQKIERWYNKNMTYSAICALMTIESSFIPFPSEIVVPPAAYIASQPDSNLNHLLIILFATLGSLMGAYINYALSISLGRALIYKLADSKVGTALLLNSEKIRKAEAYFNKYGNISTFIGRLIPGIRQLISIPAGLAKMNFFKFSLYTVLGAGVWNCVLAYIGYLAHGQADLINKYNKEISIVMVILVVAAGIFGGIKYYLKLKKK